jgi:hypothetical protein
MLSKQRRHISGERPFIAAPRRCVLCSSGSEFRGGVGRAWGSTTIVSSTHTTKTLSENFSMKVEQRRFSPRMDLPPSPFSKESSVRGTKNSTCALTKLMTQMI